MTLQTYDQQTVTSTNAFLLGELERLDPTLHMPLSNITWGRDIDLREDVTIADETSSFTNTDFAAVGGENTSGKNLVGDNTTEIPGINIDTHKKNSNLYLWAMTLGYSVVELEKCVQLGRPIDTQKYEGLKLKHQMDTDEMVYLGDKQLGEYGLVNNPNVKLHNSTQSFEGAEAKQILDTINDFISEVWKQSGYAVCPERLLLPGKQYSLLTQPVTEAGSMSILEYVSTQCVSNGVNGKPLEILPLKWLEGRWTGGEARMVAYTRDKRYVRFPMVPLGRTPLEHRGLMQMTTYYGKLGVVEFVYPETLGYADGI